MIKKETTTIKNNQWKSKRNYYFQSIVCRNKWQSSVEDVSIPDFDNGWTWWSWVPFVPLAVLGLLPSVSNWLCSTRVGASSGGAIPPNLFVVTPVFCWYCVGEFSLSWLTMEENNPGCWVVAMVQPPWCTASPSWFFTAVGSPFWVLEMRVEYMFPLSFKVLGFLSLCFLREQEEVERRE